MIGEERVRLSRQAMSEIHSGTIQVPRSMMAGGGKSAVPRVDRRRLLGQVCMGRSSPMTAFHLTHMLGKRGFHSLCSRSFRFDSRCEREIIIARGPHYGRKPGKRQSGRRYAKGICECIGMGTLP